MLDAYWTLPRPIVRARNMHTRRRLNLQRDLSDTFAVPVMEQVWKRTVRAGLRHQTLNDLHDYLDVHRNLRNYLLALRSDVTAGSYRPDPPQVVLHEKRDGISRRLMLPSPGDAILLQTIVETLEPAIKENQPTANSYYSRSHDHPRIESIDGSFGYPWRNSGQFISAVSGASLIAAHT
jgi:hypothetical protein